MLHEIILGLFCMLVMGSSIRASERLQLECSTDLQKAIVGHKDMVRIVKLIFEGADINAQNTEGKTALTWAILTKNTAVVRLLLNSDRLIRTTTDCNGWTYQHYAVYSGAKDILELMVEKEMPLDVLTHSTNTSLLEFAALFGKRNIVSFLLEHGCPVNTTNVEGSTPLHAAAMGTNIEICSMLLEAKADIDACNNAGSTPLTISLTVSETDYVCNYLLAQNADLHKGHSGVSPACVYLMPGRKHFAELLTAESIVRYERQKDGSSRVSE